ncbi:MAG: DUF5103 domain-containing protein [Prevotella sp.]|nr:DUF5103 domain-containing protein [Prevotella sp.]
MKRLLLSLCLFLPIGLFAKNRIYTPQVRSLQAVVNQNWISPVAVMHLGTDDVLNVSFDELSHQYHRYIYRMEHCEADWSPSEELFESEWLEGFNDNTIDNYENSINTTVAYTHYWLQIPNDRCRLKLSGNYKLHVLDEDNDNEEVLVVEFMVTEQTMGLNLNVTTNTDIDLNASHQQVSMGLSYGKWQVTSPAEQIQTVVMQNGQTPRRNVSPTYQNPSGSVNLFWTHNHELIFDAGNEYHKFEVLDVSHPTMGIDFIRWDGRYYQAFPFTNEPRINYIYDEDANGAFYIRNSDNRENDIASDYVWVNYRLKVPRLPEGKVIVDGQWTTDENIYNYVMAYNEEEGMYHTRILQKQGYYNYQYLWLKDNGTVSFLPLEGNFYQTENRYQAFAYFKGTGERTWRLVSFRDIALASSDTYDRTRQ